MEHEKIEHLRSVVWALDAEYSNLGRELRLQRNELDRLRNLKNDSLRAKKVANSSRRNSQETNIDAVARFARKKGILAARAIRDGCGDAGHIRDLADAAIFGSSIAAIAIADITQATATDDNHKQRVEAHAWLRLAVLLDPKSHEIAKRASDLGQTMTKDDLAASRSLLGVMEERRSVLLTNPWD